MRVDNLHLVLLCMYLSYACVLWFVAECKRLRPQPCMPDYIFWCQGLKSDHQTWPNLHVCLSGVISFVFCYMKLNKKNSRGVHAKWSNTSLFLRQHKDKHIITAHKTLSTRRTNPHIQHNITKNNCPSSGTQINYNCPSSWTQITKLSHDKQHSLEQILIRHFLSSISRLFL